MVDSPSIWLLGSGNGWMRYEDGGEYLRNMVESGSGDGGLKGCLDTWFIKPKSKTPFLSVLNEQDLFISRNHYDHNRIGKNTSLKNFSFCYLQIGCNLLHDVHTSACHRTGCSVEDVRIKSLLDAVGITAGHVCVNTALKKLVLLMELQEIMLSSYYCWPEAVVNAAKGNTFNVVKASAYYEEIDGGYVAFGGNPKGGKITVKFLVYCFGQNINEEAQIHAKVDGKKIIITESSVRRDLRLEDEEDEAVHKELGDSLVRVATTASSLEAEQDSGSGPRCQETIGDTTAQTRVESSDNEESLGENASKQEKRIDVIDADKDSTLVNVQDDAKMFDVNDLGGEEVCYKEITLSQALEALKTSKPKVKGIFIQEQEEPGKSPTTTTTITTIPKQKSQDKGNGIMVEEPMKPKKKDQIRLDEEAALRLQAEFDEEERLARERERESSRGIRSQYCLN
nr:hypothetical protein [Tanacetum cinerariifolium]